MVAMPISPSNSDFGTSAALDASGVGELVRLGTGVIRLVGEVGVRDAAGVAGEAAQRYLYQTVVVRPAGFEAGAALGLAQEGQHFRGWKAITPVVGTFEAGRDVKAAC